MALQTTINISVDFYDKKYILINAKQLDRKSRFISVACYSHGEFYPINSGEYSAYIRYRKSDNHSVFNFCEIDRKGNVIVELTEQMLASSGICCADLVIVNKGAAKVDAQTGEIINIENSSIISTMPIYIDVAETSIENSDIESSYEFSGLNEMLERAEADYTDVVLASKSWAVGNAGGIRDNEDKDNAKYYCEQAALSANNADLSEANAQSNANLAKSYAIGGTGIRDGENTDNAYYYYWRVKNAIDGLSNGFIPMGTISFSELANAEKATGFMYNMSSDFVTDDTFREGAGKFYTAGTNVYYTANEQWDCFGGAASPTATVNEVKEYLGI